MFIICTLGPFPYTLGLWLHLQIKCTEMFLGIIWILSPLCYLSDYCCEAILWSERGVLTEFFLQTCMQAKQTEWFRLVCLDSGNSSKGSEMSERKQRGNSSGWVTVREVLGSSVVRSLELCRALPSGRYLVSLSEKHPQGGKAGVNRAASAEPGVAGSCRQPCLQLPDQTN